MWDGNHRRRPLEGERFDVAVIGGGINGVAIARECAAAGRRTLLVEQNDFASGTTSRTTRIIHGGLRYLEHGEIALVRESLRERERLLRTKAHLVRPMRFLLALPPGRRSALEVRFGLWLYRRFAHARNGTRNGHDVAALERLRDRGQRWNVFAYDDAQCEFPERLAAEWLADALARGAEARNYTLALQVEVANGRTRSLRLRDRLNGSEYRVSAKWIVNASGPWADSVARAAGIAGKRMVGGVRGSHIVLPRFGGAPESAVYTEGLDGRPIFVIPWNGQLLAGTTEVNDDNDPAGAQPSAAEINYLLESARRLFPAAAIAREDIRYAMAGVRPLPFSPDTPTAAITRRHVLHDHASDGAAGMISLIGGKLTTAASVARECACGIGIQVLEPQFEEIVDVAELESRQESWRRQASACGRLTAETTTAIVSWFGRAAVHIVRSAGGDERLSTPISDGTPHVVAEAVHALRNECAETLADILLRRVPVALAGWWSEEHSRQAAQRIGVALGWSQGRVNKECDAFEQERAAFLVRVCSGVPAGIP